MSKRGKRGRGMNARLSKLEGLVGKTLENKVVDFTGTTPAGTDISTSGWFTVAWYRGGGEGADDNQFVGDKITLMSQTFRGQVIIPTIGVANDPNNQVRVLIVENLGFDTATDLDISDVLEFSSYATHGDLVFSSPYKSRGTNTKLYRVHYDKVHKLSNQGKGAQYSDIRKRIKYGKTGKVCMFSGSGNTTPNNHRLCVFAISDSAVSDHPKLHLTCRSVYKDA